MTKADTQKDAVYEWEGQWRDWNDHRVSLKECTKVVRTACAHYGVKPPKVMRWSRGFCWSPDKLGKTSKQLERPVIRLNLGGLNWATAIHEAAHWIVLHLAPASQDHGPTWLGVYFWLLDRSNVAPASALFASAREYKLRWEHRPPSWFKGKSK